MKNLIQYGSFLVAVGCVLNYDSNLASLEIAEYPKEDHKKKLITKALRDIQKFLNTANFTDGMAAFHLADFLDGNSNPVNKTDRQRALNALGIMKGSRFIASVMMQAKSNRSWHVSEVSGDCSYFGKICTNRGVSVSPTRRGIRSTRNPNEYHALSGNSIKREQLVTPALEDAYDLIPESSLVSAKEADSVEQQIEKLTPQELDDFISRLQKRKVEISAS